MNKPKNIQVSKKNNMLIVSVSVPRRRWAAQEEYYITTEELSKELSLDHEIIEVIQEPSHAIGNTKKSGASQSGVWNFLVKEEEKPKTAEDKKVTRRRKSPTAPKPPPKQTPQKKSFRGRMQSIAKNKTDNKT